ncbi:MAG: AraC family transcriptional regulator [Prevotella sp.]|nr:AraC family transcriptional regulator [Prevotella sp.]MBQ6186819.1 AraC family transcriptional regulator [Prevotella sp.]
MYSLKDAWVIMHDKLPYDDWDGKLLCVETDAGITFRTNRTQGYMSAYTFTLVTEGWLKIVYNGHELTLEPNDLYIYSPGLTVTVAEASENYHAICLLADENVTIESPIVHDLVHIAYLPIVRLHEPKINLPENDSRQLAEKMREIIKYINSDHIYKAEILRMLYSVFLLDLHDRQDLAIKPGNLPQRTEEIFINFIRLLPQHFAQHHDIAFYASKLNISTVYLSRIVRQVSARTVVDYINQMLLMEASFLLRTSQLSIVQIAERLCFADKSSFSKFFSRMKGVSPKTYRNSGLLL